VTEAVSKPRKLRPIPFGERPGKEPHNASEVVALGDSRFLFCDNNVDDALFELRLAPNGSMACPLLRRPIHGIVATSSLCLKKRKRHHKKKRKRGKVAAARESILRIAIDGDEQLRAEVMPDFRPWLVEQAPELTAAARYLPDDGGLNIEALSWDPVHQALLFGLRTPVIDGKPLIIRVRLRQFDGPWDLGNLALRYFSKVRFDRRMRVEGVARGTIAGRGAIVFVDDRGGYQVLWDDDPRLAVAELVT
jgi:hypothetical protein